MAENYSRYSNDRNVVTWFKFYEGDATTNDAGVFRTVTAGTAKYSGSAYFSHGRMGLPGFSPAKSCCCCC